MAIPPGELNFAKAIEYHYGAFPPKNLDYSRIYRPFAHATAAIARFDQMLKTMHNSEILLAPLRNQEAVISSRMEGTISTMDEILRYEADKLEGEKHPEGFRSEVIETLLYQHALKAGQAEIEKGAPFSEWLVRTLHEILLSYGRGAAKDPGGFKKEQNYLVDRTKRNVLFIPIGPEHLPGGLRNLFQYLDTYDEDPLIKTAVSHIEFESLHPFQDGNGRVGRMLITLLMWKFDIISSPHFYISGYLEENKNEYIDRMKNVSSDGDWTEWIMFFMYAIQEQAERNLAITESIRNLYEEMKLTFSEVLSSKWSTQALDFIFAAPVFRNSSFVSMSGIPAPSARRFTRILVENGLITSIQEAAGSRSALYVFEPLMKLVRV